MVGRAPKEGTDPVRDGVGDKEPETITVEAGAGSDIRCAEHDVADATRGGTVTAHHD